MNEEEKKVIEGTVKSWGLRLAVPASYLNAISVGVGDAVEWTLGEKDGKKIVILQKKEVSKDGKG